MVATFGKLDHRAITFENGLNSIEAPNESGKSTLLAFLRVMLYGFPARERGAFADKNRYAPWSLAPMQGTLELTCRSGDLTLTRDTVRAGDPMGRFSAVYTGSGEAIPFLTAEDAGEALLGVPREVYERSAFIRQSGLTVDASAELERRIAALITTSEEGASYTDAVKALKKQLNERKYNKSGRIPVLEAEIDDLTRSLDELGQFEAHKRETESSLSALDGEEAALRAGLLTHDICDAQERLEAVSRAKAAADEAARAAERAQRAIELSACPSREVLAQGRAVQEALKGRKAEIDRAEIVCEDAETVLRTFDAHNSAPSSSPIYYVCSVIGTLSLFALLACLLLKTPLLYAIILFSTAAASTIAAAMLRAKQRSAFLAYDAQRRELLDASKRATAARDALLASYDDAVAALLALIPAGSLSRVTAYITDVSAQYDTLDILTRKAREAQARYELLHAQRPTLQVPDTPVERPTRSRAELQDALAELSERRRTLQSELDRAAGLCHAVGEREAFETQLAQKREALSQAQAEYDAIALAMDTLQSANTALQSRFSPTLSRRAGELFSRLTGGKYGQVLLDRDLSAQAGESGEIVAHDAQLLSLGALDQLYLAVRLAICETVLPGSDPIPLVLDDALVRFDDARCRAALDLLYEESKTRQILLFTCQHREAAYLLDRSGVTILSL